MAMTSKVSKQDGVEVSVGARRSTPQQRREDAVDVLSEALWELWLRRRVQAQRQTPTWGAEESAHG